MDVPSPKTLNIGLSTELKELGEAKREGFACR